MSTDDELLERVWDENADPFTNTVRVRMMTERRRRDEGDGPAGVREPRRPLPVHDSGAGALHIPDADDGQA